MPDPTNFMEFSRYGYCLGNPINFVDPTGHQVRFSDFDGAENEIPGGGGGSGLGRYARLPIDPTSIGGSGYTLTLADEATMGGNPELAWYNQAEWGGYLWSHISNAANWLYDVSISVLGGNGNSTHSAATTLDQHVTSIKDRPEGGTGAAYNKQTGRGVYVLYDKSGVKYVGQGDAYSRVQDHSRDPEKGKLKALVVAPNNLSKAEARGLEQLLVGYYGGPGGQLLNKTDGISLLNPNRQMYLNAAQPLFQETLQVIESGIGK